jgi:hypothetical protein
MLESIAIDNGRGVKAVGVVQLDGLVALRAAEAVVLL